ncbi:MerR family transcriptional regulator, partial [Candidatus Marithrix sp. Canyon 246]
MKPTYRLNEFAKLINRSVKTLQKLDRLGKFKAHRTATNRRYYTHNQYLEYMGIAKNNTKKKFIVYYRVSSASQKND